MKKLTILLILGVFSLTLFAKDIPFCGKDSTKGDSCYLSMKDIYPTQANIGEYQVKIRNLPKYQEIGDKAFDKTHSAADVQKAIEKEQAKKVFPVIKAPDGNFYLVDRHHNTRGLYEYYLVNKSELHIDPLGVRVLMTVEKDYSDSATMQDFWDKMERKNYFWPYEFDQKLGEYVDYTYTSLPKNIVDLGNDPYRSAMGLAQKEAFEDPSSDDIFFFQFKWGKCVEQLGFIDPLKFDGSEELVRRSIDFLSNNTQEMKANCIGRGYENMPVPTKI